MQVDYLIIGQGLCGSFLAHFLQEKNASFVFIDENKKQTASKVSSGVINPITGRRLVRTWMIEEILPFAVNTYQSLEKKYNTNIIKQLDIVDFHTTPQMKLAFEERLITEFDYLKKLDNQEQFNTYFNNVFGSDLITQTYFVDVNNFLSAIKKDLQKNNQLIEEKFEMNDLTLNEDFVEYKNIKANKIIFCDGVENSQNKYFNLLPYSLNKGEALIVDIPNLPRNNMYKFGVTIVPWQDNLFWVGSNYEWKFDDDLPTENFRIKTEQTLQQILKIPFTVVNQLAAVRPANIERRPFVGFHPKQKNVGVFNGMGTKGCSLTPYFAHDFVNHLTIQTLINKEVDIKRFEKVLSRLEV